MRRPSPSCDTCDTTSKCSVSRFLAGSTLNVGRLRHYIARKTKTENQNTKFLKKRQCSVSPLQSTRIRVNILRHYFFHVVSHMVP